MDSHINYLEKRIARYEIRLAEFTDIRTEVKGYSEDYCNFVALLDRTEKNIKFYEKMLNEKIEELKEYKKETTYLVDFN